jgi:uncharacterized membrane protein YjfL (UPF0719 family)
MTSGLTAATYLLLTFVLCWVGKLAYGWFHAQSLVDRELTARDNAAFAVPLGAYYLGILIVMGAPLSGQPRGSLLHDTASVTAWGVLAIVLLNLASLANRRFIFRGVDLAHEILERQNLAAGIVVGGSHVANALLILGALGDEGGLVPAAVFWLYAQVLLTLAVLVYLRVVGYDLPGLIGRGNRAVALTLAGALVAIGNSLAAATGYALAGLALLFVVRQLTDWLLLPGVTIRQEVLEQEVPNVGVGYLEGLFYLGASLLIGWSL